MRLERLPDGIGPGRCPEVRVTISEGSGRLLDPDGCLRPDRHAYPRVWLEATPNPVAEGEQLRVTARLSKPLQVSLQVPVTVTDGSAEAADYGPKLGTLTIFAGELSSKQAATADGGDADPHVSRDDDAATRPSRWRLTRRSCRRRCGRGPGLGHGHDRRRRRAGGLDLRGRTPVARGADATFTGDGRR